MEKKELVVFQCREAWSWIHTYGRKDQYGISEMIMPFTLDKGGHKHEVNPTLVFESVKKSLTQVGFEPTTSGY